MCGIIGYTGRSDAVERLLSGLRALEYRGYDSAGITAFAAEDLITVKAQGRIANLAERLKAEPLKARCGIGHTRWATHGAPNDINAHPHATERLALVHNGIIENYQPIKRGLEERGATFLSDTDTEAAALLIDHCYGVTGDPVASIQQAIARLEGSYAFAILFKDRPGELFAARKDSPLIAAVAPEGHFIASDITAALQYTRSYFPLEEGDIIRLTAETIEVIDAHGEKAERPLQEARWDREAAEKGGYPHFMVKEIHEEPEAFKKTLSPRVRDGLIDFNIPRLTDESLSRFTDIRIVACGTAMHAGLVGRAIIERLARIPTQVDIASEYRYNDPILNPSTLVIVISQSGETADSIAALRLSKERGAYTLGIVNVAGSTIAREADDVLYTWAGPEISVASTKAYTVQLLVLYMLAIRLAQAKGRLDGEAARALVAELKDRVPAQIGRVIALSEWIETIAQHYADAENIFFIGRGLDCALSHEGSLKLKEISYIHSESYAAGELKHGTISLITKGMPVVAIATRRGLYPKIAANIKEVRARGAKVLLVCLKDFPEAAQLADDVIALPDSDELFTPYTAVTALQLFAYHTAVFRGCDVDKPRNLAKSVTVE